MGSKEKKKKEEKRKRTIKIFLKEKCDLKISLQKTRRYIYIPIQ